MQGERRSRSSKDRRSSLPEHILIRGAKERFGNLSIEVGDNGSADPVPSPKLTEDVQALAASSVGPPGQERVEQLSPTGGSSGAIARAQGPLSPSLSPVRRQTKASPSSLVKEV